MSSVEFSVVIDPSSRLRRRVLGAGAACGVGGILLIAFLPWPVALRVGLAAAWLAASAVEWLRYAMAARQVRQWRLGCSGTVTLTVGSGTAVVTRLAAGSVVTGSVAWLRFRLPGGGMFGELLTPGAVRDADWHRLQLIWQQGRHFIGSHRRS